MNKIIIATLIIIIFVLLRYEKVRDYFQEKLNIKYEIQNRTISNFCITKTKLCNEQGHCLIECYAMRCFATKNKTRCLRLNI